MAQIKALPPSAGDTGLIPESGRCPGEGHGNPLQYSCPGEFHGQRSLMGYSPWVAQSRTQLKQLSTHTHPWEWECTSSGLICLTRGKNVRQAGQSEGRTENPPPRTPLVHPPLPTSLFRSSYGPAWWRPAEQHWNKQSRPLEEPDLTQPRVGNTHSCTGVRTQLSTLRAGDQATGDPGGGWTQEEAPTRLRCCRCLCPTSTACFICIERCIKGNRALYCTDFCYSVICKMS